MLCEPRDGELQLTISPTFSTLSGSGSFKTTEEPTFSIITLPFISPLVKLLPFKDHTTSHVGTPVRKQHDKQIRGALSGAGYDPLLLKALVLALLHC